MTATSKPTLIKIFAYGSLMIPQSTLKTTPNAINFLPATLYHYQRIFSLVSVSSLKRGIISADTPTKEIATLAIRATYTSIELNSCINKSSFSNSNYNTSSSGKIEDVVRGIVFDIPMEEFKEYQSREARYKIVKVKVLVAPNLDDENNMEDCYTCIEQTDEEYAISLQNKNLSWETEVGQYYPNHQKLWGRKDILPLREYLLKVLQAAQFWDENHDDFISNSNRSSSSSSSSRSNSKNIGVSSSWLDNILETLLADGETTIREYMSSHPDRFNHKVLSEYGLKYDMIIKTPNDFQ